MAEVILPFNRLKLMGCPGSTVGAEDKSKTCQNVKGLLTRPRFSKSQRLASAGLNLSHSECNYRPWAGISCYPETETEWAASDTPSMCEVLGT